MISIENIFNQMILKLEKVDLDIVELALQNALEDKSTLHGRRK